MHPLLERQLRRHFGSLDAVPEGLLPLLEDIDAAYRDADEDRRLLERSMELASDELVERNRALEDAYQRIRRVDDARRDFINTAAHEINTPLTPAILQMRLLKDLLEGDPDPVKVQRCIDVLGRNLDRMMALAKDFLDSARIESGRMQIRPVPCDLAAMVRQAVEEFGPRMREKGIRLAVDAPQQVPMLCDANRIGQVLDNLLWNAFRFTPAGGAVTVRVQVRGSRGRVEVEDTGIGLTPEQIGRLFQPFTQVHDARAHNVGGTGLGLHISDGIVRASGGRIGVESRGPGAGSTFFFEIPLQAPAPRESGQT